MQGIAIIISVAAVFSMFCAVEVIRQDKADKLQSHMLRCFETGEPKACCWLAEHDVGFLAKVRCGK